MVNKRSGGLPLMDTGGGDRSSSVSDVGKANQAGIQSWLRAQEAF